MKINVYLDDVRSMPFGFHLQAFSYDECIHHLTVLPAAGYEVDILSLDHDLGDIEGTESGHVEKTGYDVICWIEEQALTNRGYKLPKNILTHSSNPAGRRNINQVIRKLYPQ